MIYRYSMWDRPISRLLVTTDYTTTNQSSCIVVLFMTNQKSVRNWTSPHSSTRTMCRSNTNIWWFSTSLLTRREGRVRLPSTSIWRSTLCLWGWWNLFVYWPLRIFLDWWSRLVRSSKDRSGTRKFKSIPKLLTFLRARSTITSKTNDCDSICTLVDYKQFRLFVMSCS